MNTFLLFIVAGITAATLQVSSSSFKENGLIPAKYTCEGENINPAISVKNIPQKTQSLALIMDDPDAPNGGFNHWIMWNIDPSVTINENSAPGTQGKNGAGKNSYAGPCPPTGTHHYHFKVYALDTKLNLQNGAGKTQLEDAMKGHILPQVNLSGFIKRLNDEALSFPVVLRD